MSQFLRVFLAVGVTALAALLACDSSPTSSTSPAGPASSNRVSGSFASDASAASRQTARANTSYDGITVSVRQDARITVDVSSNGTFTLENFPAGRVTILFTRDGSQIGEVDIRGVGANEEIRILLELTANDTVVLIEMERARGDNDADDGSSDDNSEDAGLEMELDPDDWCPEWASGGNSDDDPVFATIKGDGLTGVDLTSIMLEGPNGQVQPTSVELKSDRIEVIFEDKAAVIGIVGNAAEGDSVEVRLTGTKDGVSFELTETIRIKCDDDDSSDDASSDDSSSDDSSSS